MKSQPENESRNWLAGLPIQPGLDPVLEKMKQDQTPLTRENYLNLAYPEDVPTPWPAELEETLPQQIRDLPRE